MIKIKFSRDDYTKFPPGVLGRSTQLIEVFKVDRPLHMDFVKYDTVAHLPDKIVFYKLPKPPYLVLILITYDFGSKGGELRLWTTVRRWTPRKEEYYLRHRGEMVRIVLPEKERGN